MVIPLPLGPVSVVTREVSHPDLLSLLHVLILLGKLDERSFPIGGNNRKSVT